MSRYRKVDLRIWGDERVRRLSIPKPNGRDCWLYLLTAKETILLPGAIPAGAAAMAESLKWPVAGFRAAFDEVAQCGMAIADWNSGLVWVPNAIRFNPPENANVAMAWGKSFVELPDCELRKRILSDVEAFLSTVGKDPGAHLKAFRKGFAKGFGEAFGDGLETVSKSGAGAGAGSSFRDPQADFGSGEAAVSHIAPVENPPDDQPTEAHWGTLTDRVVTMMRAERSIAGFDDDRQCDRDALEQWAWNWVRKYEPGAAEIEQLRRAVIDFLGWSRREENGGSFSLWVCDAVGQYRVDEQRAAAAARRAS